MSTKIPIVKFLFRTDWRALSDALSSKDPYEFIDVANAGDLGQFLGDSPACLIVASLKEKEDFVQIASFMKLAKRPGQTAVFKLVVVNFSGNRQYEKAIGKLGILDIVDPNTNTKAVRFKLDFWMKSLRGQIKATPEAAASKTIKKDERDQDANRSSTDVTVSWVNSLDIEDDMWIVKKETDVKRVLSKWVVKIMGPSPYAGQWTEIKPRAWRYDFKPVSRDEFISGAGAWFYVGDQKPDFVWKDNFWVFTGEAFELFYQDKESRHSRFKLRDKVITVAKNSEFAKFKERLIVESFDKELTFKKEGLGPEGKAAFEDQADRFKNLSGNGSTDHLNYNPLEGDTNGTDDLGGDPMSMDVDPNGAKSKSHWGGKNGYREEQGEDFDGPASDKFREGAQLGLENDHKDHETKYRGHNEAEKYDAKDLMQNLHEQESHEPNAGKGSTDHIKKYYGGEETSQGRVSDGAEEAEYGGAGKTDKLKSHYGSKQASSSDLAEMDDLAGDSQTDKLSATYGGKTKEGSKQAAQQSKKNSAAQDAEAEDPFSDDDFNITLDDVSNGDLVKKRSTSDFDSEAQTDENYDEDISGITDADILPFDVSKKKSASSEGRQAALEAIEQKLAEAVAEAKVTCWLKQSQFRIPAHLDDYFDNTIIFSLDQNPYQVGQSVELEMNFNYFKKDTKLTQIGQLVNVDVDGEGKNYLTLEISEEDVGKFTAFMDLYQQRQANITEFMKRARGL